MEKQQASDRYQISPEEWEQTPGKVKALLKEMGQRLEGFESSPDPTPCDRERMIILIPSFNDWEALEKLLFLIDELPLARDRILEVTIVDDFSTQSVPQSLKHYQPHHIASLNRLRLRRNLGHQRAIAVGLSYIYHHINCDFVVVMDGDGEDSPCEIEKLRKIAEKTGSDRIIFAKRSKRSESQVFKFFYFLYQQIYRFAIGRKIGVGNFSLLPAKLLTNVVVISEIWNHYSSGIYRSKIPYSEIDVPRAKRLGGKPKMNLTALVTHGLSSIAVYGDIVGTRILLGILYLLVFVIVALGIVFVVRLFTPWAVPGWATYVSGLLILFLFQLISIGTIFSMIVLSARNTVNFIPIRDYSYFVDTYSRLNL